jgi:hypothetical protein
MIDLTELRRLADAATPGPWGWDRNYWPATVTAGIAQGSRTLMSVAGGSHVDSAEGVANVVFASHARTAIPDLIAEVARLRAIEVALKARREWIAQDKDKDWLSCPDPHCEECLAAKNDLLQMLDAIERGEGPTT